MPPCKHETLDFVGNQKTDDGVNAYYKCKACGVLLILTPSRQMYSVPGVKPEHAAAAKKSPTS